MKALAQLAGVSVATVSKALQDKDDIGEETKKRIQELAREHNYAPNHIARSLRIRTTNVLGVLIPDNSDLYFARIIKGIEDVARKNDYAVIVLNTNESSEEEQECISTLKGLMVAGILSVPIDISNYRNVGIPVMLLARLPRGGDPHDMHYVVNDDYKGAYMATEHLIESGFEQIFFVNGPKNIMASDSRMKGYRGALEAGGIKFDSSKVLPGHTTMEDGFNALEKVMKLADTEQPLGILCFTDYIAIGVLAALKTKETAEGGQIRVVGYDDLELLNYILPPISSVKQARYQMGVMGTEILLGIIVNSEKEGFTSRHHITLEPQLVVRG